MNNIKIKWLLNKNIFDKFNEDFNLIDEFEDGFVERQLLIKNIKNKLDYINLCKQNVITIHGDNINEVLTFNDVLDIINNDYLNTKNNSKEYISLNIFKNYFLYFKEEYIKLLNKIEINEEISIKCNLPKFWIILFRDIFHSINKIDNIFINKLEYIEKLKNDYQLINLMDNTFEFISVDDKNQVDVSKRELFEIIEKIEFINDKEFIIWDEIMNFIETDNDNPINNIKKVQTSTLKWTANKLNKQTNSWIDKLEDKINKHTLENIVIPEFKNKKITIPKDPSFMKREPKSTIKTKKFENYLKEKEEEELNLINKKFKAKEVPLDSKMNLLENMEKERIIKKVKSISNSHNSSRVVKNTLYDKYITKYNEKKNQEEKIDPELNKKFKSKEMPALYSNLRPLKEIEEEKKKKKEIMIQKHKENLMKKIKEPVLNENNKKANKLKKIEEELYKECNFNPKINKNIPKFEDMHKDLPKIEVSNKNPILNKFKENANKIKILNKFKKKNSVINKNIVNKSDDFGFEEEDQVEGDQCMVQMKPKKNNFINFDEEEQIKGDQNLPNNLQKKSTIKSNISNNPIKLTKKLQLVNEMKLKEQKQKDNEKNDLLNKQKLEKEKRKKMEKEFRERNGFLNIKAEKESLKKSNVTIKSNNSNIKQLHERIEKNLENRTMVHEIINITSTNLRDFYKMINNNN